MNRVSTPKPNKKIKFTWKVTIVVHKLTTTINKNKQTIKKMLWPVWMCRLDCPAFTIIYKHTAHAQYFYLYKGTYLYLYTLSGRIGKVVASHAAVARSSPAEVGLIYTMHVALRGYCPWGWGVRPVNWIYRLWHHCP